MNAPATHAVTTPIPVQLAAAEFTACIFPPLSRPTRGPTCTLGSPRLLTLILGVLYTGMPWQCLLMPKDATGTPALPDTHVYRAFATWADEGSRQQAFIARVGHLSDEQKLAVRIRHGDGTHTVAKNGAMGSATRALSTHKGSRSSP